MTSAWLGLGRGCAVTAFAGAMLCACAGGSSSATGSVTGAVRSIVHSIMERTRLPGLSAGSHTITVEVADGTDRITTTPPPVTFMVIAQ